MRKEDLTYRKILFFDCDSGGIQTHNLLIRSQVLYSVELRSQTATIVLNCECKGTANYLIHQIFQEVFSIFVEKSMLGSYFEAFHHHQEAKQI